MFLQVDVKEQTDQCTNNFLEFIAYFFFCTFEVHESGTKQYLVPKKIGNKHMLFLILSIANVSSYK